MSVRSGVLAPTMDGTLLVAEVFGPTIQGEGPSCGRRAMFLRLGGCNLHCVWCDTPYTWDWKGQNGTVYDPKAELKRVPFHELYRQLNQIGAPLLVVSGGEPLLQARNLTLFLGAVKTQRRTLRIEVETNGTRPLTFGLQTVVDQFNVSPKLDSSGNHLVERFDKETLRYLVTSGKAAFKFVATKPGDLAEVALLAEEVGIPASRVWIMAEGTTAERQERGIAALADEVVRRGWNLSPRLHVLAWGNTRGV